MILESSPRKRDPNLSLTAVGLCTVLEESSVGCLLLYLTAVLYSLTCPAIEGVSPFLELPNALSKCLYHLVKIRMHVYVISNIVQTPK